MEFLHNMMYKFLFYFIFLFLSTYVDMWLYLSSSVWEVWREIRVEGRREGEGNKMVIHFSCLNILKIK
jgi:hypothetical protein